MNPAKGIDAINQFARLNEKDWADYINGVQDNPRVNEYRATLAAASHNDLQTRLRQYLAARDGIADQRKGRVEFLKSMAPASLAKLAKAHRLAPCESPGETMFAILERELPMPEMKRFGITPDDVANVTRATLNYENSPVQ